MYLESPSIICKNSPSQNKKTDNNPENINNNQTSNAEYFLENIENKFSLSNVQATNGTYDAQMTGNFKSINPIFGKFKQDNADKSEIYKRISSENIMMDSFKSDGLYKRSCFFCTRNKEKLLKIHSIENNANISNNDNNHNFKSVDESMTDKLKTVMKSFNIERRFSEKLDEKADLCIRSKNEEFENSLAEINSCDFNNYYPKNLSFILLDLRISVDKTEKFYDYKAGFLPMTVVVEQEELIDDHVNKTLLIYFKF